MRRLWKIGANFEISDFPVHEPFPSEAAEQGAILAATTVHDTAKANRGAAYNEERVIWHSRDELSFLYQLASGMYDSSDMVGHVFQGGAFCGGSACLLGLALKESDHKYKPAIAVDIWRHGSPDPKFQVEMGWAHAEARLSMLKLELEHHLYFVMGENTVFLDNFMNSPIRLGFLDSSHSYKGTLLETHAILKRIAWRGWLVFHDYFKENLKVSHAVNEIFNAYHDRKWYAYNFRNRFLIIKFDREI